MNSKSEPRLCKCGHTSTKHWEYLGHCTHVHMAIQCMCEHFDAQPAPLLAEHPYIADVLSEP